MNEESDEIEPFIEPLEITQDETFVNTTVSYISLIDRSVIYQTLTTQGPAEHQIHLDSITLPTLTPSISDYFSTLL